jgi:hypothetical protein
MASKGWFVVAGLWLGAVLLWMRFGPTQSGHVWRATEANRLWIVSTTYVFALAHQVFIFGWLIPLGLGIYKLIRK